VQVNGSSAVKEGTRSESVSAPPVRVQVGIDAAVVANHHVCVRAIGVDGRERTERFLAAPTLAGLALLTRRLFAVSGRGGGRGADVDDVAVVVGRGI
jgi:hypothetical protein